MENTKVNNGLLIIGPPNSGKTTFLAQLYGRIQAKKGRITLTRAPQNITGIKNAYERLADGLETEATPATDNLEVVIPVKIDGQELELVFKDYGGEQVRDITKLLEYDKTWQQRTQENDRWILFIRPGEIYHHYDLSITGYAKIDSALTVEGVHNELSHQYNFIELIQALLHARGIGIQSDLQVPKLVVVLTCWDELHTIKTPEGILKEKLPLFFQFIEALWSSESFTILGLSPQEFPLDNDQARDKYLDELPESFGYLVDGNGKIDRDLTKVIELALQI
jgi:energy-coupling factor transporter ATP-binding protein EcfA2